VNPLRCAVRASRKPGVAIPGHPFAACGEPLEAARAPSWRARPRKSLFSLAAGTISAFVSALAIAGAAAAGALAGTTPIATAPSVNAPAVPATLPLFAEHARLAAKGLLIAIAAAGGRLVAVGDHGIIVFSDDQGTSWTQAEAVPTQALLTGVCFLDAQHGIAVGHDEVIVTSADAGRTWKRTHYAPQAQRPLLDVWCGARGQAIAVGAYSTYLTSADSGASWHEVPFAPAPPRRPPGAAAGTGTHAAREAAAREPAAHAGTADEGAAEQGGGGGGFHLNRIVAAGAARLYIAGEAGHLYASDDGGATWLTLASPYEGSFFGVLPLPGEGLLAFGLRGHLYRSTDAGSTWSRIDTGTVALLDGAAQLAAGGIAIVGFSGVVLVSRDGGQTFTLQQQSDRAGLSAAVTVGDERLAAVGEDGAKLIILDATAARGEAR
jgi:photosystem II stability/assembly factor-like uncharacterized protein